MSGVELRGDLEAVVARMLAGPVAAVADQVAAETARNAPAARTWVTDGDESVRPSHAALDGVTIPGNLRFQMPPMVYERKGRGRDGKAVNESGGWKLLPNAIPDLARLPRDVMLPLYQRIECRCQVVVDAGVIAASVHAGGATVTGTRVVSDVTVTFSRIAESEFPDAEDGGGGWMRAAARTVAARYR
jgi:hypothetical protein